MQTDQSASFPTDQPLITVSLNNATGIYILSMKANDNRFTLVFMAALNQAIDWIEQSFSARRGLPAALITTTESPKIFSNGLVLEEAFKTGPSYFAEYQKILARVLAFPMPTVAAINGHAFAGGCMFALAHDYRVMRADLGFMCLNEVDLPSPLTPGMTSIIKCKTRSPALFKKMILEGHRFTAQECLANELIDVVVEKGHVEVNEAAFKLGQKFSVKVANKKVGGKVYQFLKQDIYSETIKVLTDAQLGYVKDFIAMATGKAKM